LFVVFGVVTFQKWIWEKGRALLPGVIAGVAL
jgi:hypothetical protein